MFVDTHAHLFFKDFEHDVDDVIRRAKEVGVEYIVCPGTDLETSRQSIALAERFDMVFAAVGFHPHDAKKVASEDGTLKTQILDEIQKLSEHPKVVAIGEIGLDYHYNYSPPEIQRQVFSEQIRIARERDLPIIIHTREAETDVLNIVDEQLRLDSNWREAVPKGVFHCFPGDIAMARKVIVWGFFISIPGPVTFPSKPGKPNTMTEVAAEISPDRILLETDSPFLAPHPYRGKRNEPANIPFIAKKISELKNCSVEDIGEKSTAGAKSLFSIK